MNTNSIWALIALSVVACGSPIEAPQTSVIDPSADAGDAGIDSPSVEVMSDGGQETTFKIDTGSPDLGVEVPDEPCVELKSAVGICPYPSEHAWSYCLVAPSPECGEAVSSTGKLIPGEWCCSPGS